MKRRVEMPEEIREKCLKNIADSCELDIKELCQKYAEEPLEMDSFAMFNLVLQLEEEFKIEYHDFEELTFHMNELDDLVGYLVKLIQEKGDER